MQSFSLHLRLHREDVVHDDVAAGVSFGPCWNGVDGLLYIFKGSGLGGQVPDWHDVPDVDGLYLWSVAVAADGYH